MTTTSSTIAGQSPADFVRTLSDEQKYAVLTSLLQEASRLKGAQSAIALAGPRGEPIGYFVPVSAAAAHLKVVPPPLTPEREAAIRQAIATPDDTFGMDKVLNDLSQEAQS